MTDVATLRVDVQSDTAVKAAQDLDRLGDQAAMTQKQVGGMSRGFSSLSEAMKSNNSRMMAMQLSQVGQQTMATGNFVQALAIQLPDLALGFGTIGIAAGVAAGALLPLAVNMLSGGDSAEEMQSQIDALQSAIAKYGQAAKLASMSTRELEERFGSASGPLRDAVDLLERIAASEAQAAIDGLAQSMSNLLGTGGGGERRSELAKFFDANIFLAFNDAQREARQTARDLTAEFQSQQKALQTANGDLDAQIAATSALLKAAEDLSDLSGERSKEERELLSLLSESLSQMLSMAEVDVASNLAAGADEAARLASNAQLAAAALSGVVAQRAAAAGVASGAIPPEALADLPRGAAQTRATEAALREIEAARRASSRPSRSSGGRSRSRAGGGGASAQLREQAEAQREVERWIERTRTAQEQLNAELADLEELNRMGYFAGNPEAYARAVAMVNEEFQQTQFEPILDGFQGISDAMASAIVNAEDMGEAFRGILQQMAIDLLSSGIQEMLAALLTSSGGGGVSALASIFGGFRADGGPVASGKAYVVGERGPELFMPGQSGQIIPNGAGGSSTVRVELGPGLVASILDQAAGQSVQIVGAATQQQSKAFPARAQSLQARGV